MTAPEWPRAETIDIVLILAGELSQSIREVKDAARRGGYLASRWSRTRTSGKAMLKKTAQNINSDDATQARAEIIDFEFVRRFPPGPRPYNRTNMRS
jgi:hypothetical protein